MGCNKLHNNSKSTVCAKKENVVNQQGGSSRSIGRFGHRSTMRNQNNTLQVPDVPERNLFNRPKMYKSRQSSVHNTERFGIRIDTNKEMRRDSSKKVLEKLKCTLAS